MPSSSFTGMIAKLSGFGDVTKISSRDFETVIFQATGNYSAYERKVETTSGTRVNVAAHLPELAYSTR